MSNWVETTAKTVEKAIEQALETLNAGEAEVLIEVLDEGESGGLLGFGRKPARVRVTLVDETGEVSGREPEISRDEPGEVVFADEGEDDEMETEDEIDHEVEEAALDYVQAIMQGIGIHGRLGSYISEDNNLHIEVTGRDCGPAIGHHGETLDAISYLTDLVANRKSEKHVRVVVDIGGYRRRREGKLRDLAERTADRVESSGEAGRLKQMNPAERRIIHLALKDRPGVSTRSEGVDPDRYVVIEPSAGN
jgi:spoIIIJ-associated protein